jgi:hypothetical protein
MGTDIFLSWQFGMTLIAVLAFGIWQYLRIRRSQNRDAATGRGDAERGTSPLAQRAQHQADRRG